MAIQKCIIDDGSFYIASCLIYKGFALGEGSMYRLLKVTADGSDPHSL